MKRILLPLLAATPILTALVPHAGAAAITAHHGSLNPRLIGAGSLKKRFNNGVPVAAFKTDHLVSASTASAEESWANAISSGALTITKTGAGTLTLSGGTFTAIVNESDFIRNFTSAEGHSAVILTGTGSSLLDVNGATLTLSATVLVVNSSWLTQSTNFNVSQTLGTLTVAGGGFTLLAPDGQALSDAPTAAPVPEPGTAMLFALGMLAASHVRRRKI